MNDPINDPIAPYISNLVIGNPLSTFSIIRGTFGIPENKAQWEE